MAVVVFKASEGVWKDGYGGGDLGFVEHEELGSGFFACRCCLSSLL